MLKFKKMGSDKVPLLLITANVGSIFEEPTTMLPIWTSEFLQAVSQMDPKFIALHLQEVGGKTYEKSMQYVQEFVQRLCDCPELRLFDKIRIFMDEDFSSPEKFTALGNMYFAHSSLTDLKIWDFELKSYIDVVGKEVHSGNIEKVTTKEKAKFPQHFFPECKWSRKGFLRTRWQVRGTAVEFVNIHLFHDASNLLAMEPFPSVGFLRTRWQVRGTAVEFVNIHLFHDASNLLAMEPFPSVYCRSRRRALRHTLRHLHSDVNAAPYFIFGDFNFRADTGGVVKKLTEDLTASRVQNSEKADASRLQFRDKQTSKVVLSIGKKEFAHTDHQTIFREPWRYDRELEALKPHLYEFPVKFPPSYPFEEDVQLPTHYMKTRCPSWCDRILLSQSARLLVQDARPADNKHHSTSRKSVTDSESSGRVSSSDSSPARSGSPARQNNQGSPGKSLEKKSSVADLDALSVPGINVSRKSIADPTSVQHAINAGREHEMSATGQRRKLVRNQSEGSPKGEALSAELRRLVDAPAARRRVTYTALGAHACMGDHKPIYLRVLLQTDRGRLACCSPPCELCARAARISTVSPPRLLRLPTHPHITPPTLPHQYSYDEFKLKAQNTATQNLNIATQNLKQNIRTRTGSLNEILLRPRIPQVEITTADSNYDGTFVDNIDRTLLTVRQCVDPYTPESIDSHSPNVEASSGSEDMNELSDMLGETTIEVISKKLNRDRSVSPTQLKNRLDKLLENQSIPELQRLNSRESCKSEGSRRNFCCFALKCYGFCRRKARRVKCDRRSFSCCTS